MSNSSTLVGENREESEKQSAEKFQKFMYDVFEKNGVINDLRAYLRGHIVNVLKSAQSGETLSCQKHFTQRLELTFQAINILIAEYLLRLEFSYTLSVFVSEIPLANMVFSFARMLMETHDHSELRFKDADVFSILNYIGLKCDSDHANSVVEMYNDNKKTPLLLCILKCLPMYKTSSHTEPHVLNEQDSSTEDSTTSKSSIDKCHKGRYEKCKHYSHCKACRSRMARLKEKYKRKERGLAKSLRQSSVNSLNVESFMKNISVMEKGLIDELFQQLKSVYEAEIDMMKQEDDKRVKRSLIAHAVQLQKKKEQLESSFKAREAALAQALQQKKRVLWSVARMLKQQHQQMARAMNGVTAEARDLALKEESLKTQLTEAETILRQRGEDMRKQISAELTILSNHLKCMKLERDNINKERAQLESLKLTPNYSEQEHLRSHYDLLKDELLILKKYMETVKLDSKCVIERSTMTELSGLSGLLDNDVILNNRKDASEDEGPKRLVNDLKKHKNVNFEQTTSTGVSEHHRLVYEYQPRSRSRSRSSSEAGDAPDADADDGELILLQDENRRLKEFARQQKEHIDTLAWQQARLQAQISTTLQPTILPHTSTYAPQTSNFAPQSANFIPQTSNVVIQSANFTPQTSNLAPQSANFTSLPTSYATISANFPPQPTTLNAQSATFAPQVGNITNFTTQSANFTPQTVHFSARSAFFAPQNSNIPQSGSFGTSVVHQANVIQRPRTASPTGRRPIGHRLQPSTSVANLNVGWRVGAGEELSVFTSVPTRVVLPGDNVPFIGLVGNRHTDNRRYLINQWRSLRRRLSPIAGVSKRSASISKDKPSQPCIADPTITSLQNEMLSNLEPSCSKNDTSRLDRNYLQAKSTAEKCVKAEQKSSKEKLKDFSEGIKTPTPMTLEKSPNSVLREAKLRLRKLEIEAEAVEKSYLDFRRKKEAREEREKRQERDGDIEEIKRSTSLKKLNETYTKETQREPLLTLDIDKLLNDINTKLDIPSFKNKNSTEFKINPIPKVYSDTQDVTKVYSENKDIAKVYSESLDVKRVDSKESKKENYLETPLNEFRRMYHSERRLESMERERSPASKSDINRSLKRDIIREFKNKEKELEIFKHNLGKIYNMSENSIGNYPSELSVNEVVDIEKDIIENVSDVIENQNEPDNLSYTIENENKTNENINQEGENLSGNKEIENFNENIKELELFTENPEKVNDIKQIEDTIDNNDEVSGKNILRVDVENISEVNSVQDESKTRGFLLYVESAVDNAASESDIGTKISTQMTIVVGPKRSPRKINTGEETIERAPDISTDILEPLYNISNEQISSVQMQLELSKDVLNTTLSELEINEDLDYPDDFSADVDNYNSPSEFRNRSRISSPISLGKTSDDENFWES